MSDDTDTPKPITYEQRRDDFAFAVQLLGGQRTTAQLLTCSERTMRALLSGERHIHDGFMDAITTALRTHALACRELAKRTDPLFTANRVPPPPRGYPAQQRAQNRPQETETHNG
jgi:DNA-binding transcriptional regulator YdaS (Cro superfamily)